MNDRFKFRVWDGKRLNYDVFSAGDNHRIEDRKDEIIGVCEIRELGPVGETWYEYEECKCILMQCTGLKNNTKWEQLTLEEQNDWFDRGLKKEDWNGKLIYEGDILADAESKEPVAKVIFEMGAFKKESLFPDEDGVIWKNHFTEEDSKCYIVLGNIYEKKTWFKNKFLIL